MRRDLPQRFMDLAMSMSLVGLLVSGCASATTSSSHLPVVQEVVDGDTLILRIDHSVETVRLLGVDTPETSDPNRPEQCFGAEATRFVRSLLPPGTEVRLERDTEARDRYGRLLVYIFRGNDDTFVNVELLAQGFADLAIYPPNEAYRSALTEAHKAALTREAGLWTECGAPDIPLDPPPLSAG